MPRDFKIELRGKKNADGTFNAGVWEDGKQVADEQFIVTKDDAGSVRLLYNLVLEKYGKGPEVPKSLDECFPLSFFAPDLP